MLKKMQARTYESDNRIETMATALQDRNKKLHGKEVDNEQQGEDKRENLEAVKKGQEEERSAPLVDCIKQLLKDCSMFNNYFNVFDHHPKREASS